MKLQQFLKRLEKTPRNWRLEFGCLRLPVGTRAVSCCPIIAVSRRGGWNFRYLEVGQSIGLSKRLSEEIAAAADSNTSKTRALRKQLRKACGL